MMSYFVSNGNIYMSEKIVICCILLFVGNLLYFMVVLFILNCYFIKGEGGDLVMLIIFCFKDLGGSLLSI